MVSKEELTQFIADTYIATYGCVNNNQNYNNEIWQKIFVQQIVSLPDKEEKQTIETQFYSFKNGYGASIYMNNQTGEYVISIGGGDYTEYVGESQTNSNNFKTILDTEWMSFLTSLNEIFKDKQNINVSITGCSIGGAIATYIADKFNKNENDGYPIINITSIVAFNPVGVNGLLDNLSSTTISHLTNYVALNDPLSMLYYDKLVGNTNLLFPIKIENSALDSNLKLVLDNTVASDINNNIINDKIDISDWSKEKGLALWLFDHYNSASWQTLDNVNAITNILLEAFGMSTLATINNLVNSLKNVLLTLEESHLLSALTTIKTKIGASSYILHYTTQNTNYLIGTNNSETIVGDQINESKINNRNIILGNYGNDTITGKSSYYLSHSNDYDDSGRVKNMYKGDLLIGDATSYTFEELYNLPKDNINEIINLSKFESENDGDDIINGGSGHDIIIGGGGQDFLYGDDGDDTIYGGTGDDIIIGGARQDVLYGNEGKDILIAGENIVNQNSYQQTKLNFSKNNSINADNYKSTINGVAERNILVGGSDEDILIGDIDSDVLIGDSTTLTIQEIKDSRENNENINLSSFESANDGNDYLDGGEGEDLLIGGGGNDVLIGGEGEDTLYGGSGNDVIIAGNTSLSVDSLKNLSAIQNSIEASAYQSQNGGENKLYGNAGNDILIGDKGDDILDGGSDADYMYGGDGNDTYIFDDDSNMNTDNVIEKANEGDSDTIDFSNVSSAVDVDLTQNSGKVFANNSDVSGIENIYGTNSNDKITGQNLNNVLVGNEGNDTLSGGAGDDVLIAGTAKKTPLLSEERKYTNEELLQIISEKENINSNDFESENGGTNELHGGEDDDLLIGDKGDDTLYGESGNDYLYGGKGNDILLGGAGSDHLVQIQEFYMIGA